METSTNLVTQLQEDYLSYSMAVLVGRSIPDIYDGLKPAQRRTLQTMLEEGLLPGKPYVKCARTTGLTSAYYHPHGSAYGALINMATEWNNNIPWIDCHGNVGSSVDNPAAERYVENRLRPSAIDLLLQDKEVWDTRPNYDGSRKEAVRFNSSVPAVLLNGDSGIAVGFATKLAPHNLRSIIDAVKLICKDTATEKAHLENLRKAREGLLPDFPTGTQIIKDEQLDNYTKTGSGSIRCMACVKTGEQKRDGRAKNRPTLSFTNLPPGTNPEKLGEQIKNEVEKGRIEGVAEVNDLSDMSGDCIEVVAKPGVDPENLKKLLYAYTDLDTKFSTKTLVIDGTKPVELSPIQICQRWVNWRLDRLQVKFEHELELKEARLHIVLGLLKATDKMDLVIKKIRAAKDKAEAKASLMATPLKFSDRQAEAILEMRLRQLTGLDQTDLTVEGNFLQARINELEELVSDETSGTTARKLYMLEELTELGKRHGEARRSPLVEPPASAVSVPPGARTKAPPTASKPRFMMVDTKRGTVEQVKGPRGALVVDSKDKVILMTEDGMLKKVPATFKGTISNAYSKVAIAKPEAEVSKRVYLAVFELEGQLKAMTLSGEDLCKTTSTGKQWLPEGAVLTYFGEGTFSVTWVSTRKKPSKLDLTLKRGKPGGKGIKVANLSEVKSENGGKTT